MNLRKYYILFSLIVNVVTCFPQQVSVSDFILLQDGKTARLYWVVDSGATCNGIDILRSGDSLNYNKVGEILGVCGSANTAVSYSFIDLHPNINSQNYYKLQLGLGIFSDVRVLFIKYIEPGKLIVKRNPSGDKISLEFNNDNLGTLSLAIFDNSGRSIYSLNEIEVGEITLYNSDFSTGIYYYSIFNKDRTTLFKGKLVLGSG